MMTQCLAAAASIHIFTSSRLSLRSKEAYLHRKTPIFPPVPCGVFCSDSTVHSAPALQDRCQCTLHTLPPTLQLHTLQLQAVLSNHTLHHVSPSCHDHLTYPITTHSEDTAAQNHRGHQYIWSLQLPCSQWRFWLTVTLLTKSELFSVNFRKGSIGIRNGCGKSRFWTPS